MPEGSTDAPGNSKERRLRDAIERPFDENLISSRTDRIINAQEAAEILDVSGRTILRLCRDGSLRAYKRAANSSPWHIFYDSLLAHIESMHEQAFLQNGYRSDTKGAGE